MGSILQCTPFQVYQTLINEQMMFVAGFCRPSFLKLSSAFSPFCRPRQLPAFSISSKLFLSVYVDLFDSIKLILLSLHPSYTSLVEFCLVFFQKIYAAKHNYGVSPNREMVAIGMSNMIGACFGAFPASGSLPRSRVADMAGARTPASNFFAALVGLFGILVLGPLLITLPKAVSVPLQFLSHFHHFFQLIRLHFLICCCYYLRFPDGCVNGTGGHFGRD